TQQYGVVSEEKSEISESGTSSVSSSSDAVSPAATGSDRDSLRLSLWPPIKDLDIHAWPDYACAPITPSSGATWPPAGSSHFPRLLAWVRSGAREVYASGASTRPPRL